MLEVQFLFFCDSALLWFWQEIINTGEKGRIKNLMKGHVLCFKLVESDLLSVKVFGCSGHRLGCCTESSTDDESSSSSDGDEEGTGDGDGFD